jgi:hypothetical protein
MDGGRPKPVVAEQREPAVQCGQLVQVDAIDVEGIAELMIYRNIPGVFNSADV